MCWSDSERTINVGIWRCMLFLKIATSVVVSRSSKRTMMQLNACNSGGVTATPTDIHSEVTGDVSLSGQFSESGLDRGDLSDSFSMLRRSYAVWSLEEDTIIVVSKTI